MPYLDCFAVGFGTGSTGMLPPLDLPYLYGAHATWWCFRAGSRLRRGDLKLHVRLHSVSRSGPLRIDAAVMLWAATHLDLLGGLETTRWAAVVRNGSRYGRRSGSPRLRNSCRITWMSPSPFTLAAPGVSREKPPRVSGCSSARVTSRPRPAYRTVRRWHEQLPMALTGQLLPPARGSSISSKKSHLSHQTRSSQSGRELLLTALFGRKSKPHEMWVRVTALTLISRGFRHRPD